MGQFIDLTGKKFNRLTVIKRVENKDKRTMWLCKCECGNETIIRGEALRKGKIKSCGCYNREIISELRKKRRIYKKEFDRLRSIFWGIKRRCNNKASINYSRYGAKGVTICEEWSNNELSFCEWSINNGYKNGLTIDRIDNNKGYSPDNCRWVTSKEQNRNRRITLKYAIDGITKPLGEWTDIYGIGYSMVYKRLKRGWDIKTALTKEVKNANRTNIC